MDELTQVEKDVLAIVMDSDDRAQMVVDISAYIAKRDKSLLNDALAQALELDMADVQDMLRRTCDRVGRLEMTVHKLVNAKEID